MSARSLVEAALVTACPLLHPSSTAGPDEYFDFIVDEILLHSPHVESAVMLRNVLGEHLMSVLDPAEVPQVCRRLFLALRALDGVLPQANEENVGHQISEILLIVVRRRRSRRVHPSKKKKRRRTRSARLLAKEAVSCVTERCL